MGLVYNALLPGNYHRDLNRASALLNTNRDATNLNSRLRIMRKILIIEDEIFIRDNLIELLEIEGFDAFGAENGQLGVHSAQEHRPDLILCDVMMPDLDGFGVLETLRDNPLTARIPFMFLTASADRKNLRRFREVGINDYVLKPFNVDHFLALVTARLEESTAR